MSKLQISVIQYKFALKCSWSLLKNHNAAVRILNPCLKERVSQQFLLTYI